MNIRFGTKEDIEQIGEAIKGSWVAHVDNEPEFLNRKTLLGYDLVEYFANCFNGNGKSYLLIAEVGSTQDSPVCQGDMKIAGFAKLDVQEIQKFYNETTVFYIDDLYTMEAFREKGVATFLLKEAEKLAKEKGIKWLKGRIYTWNEPAQKTVESAGFKNMYSEWFKILE